MELIACSSEAWAFAEFCLGRFNVAEPLDFVFIVPFLQRLSEEVYGSHERAECGDYLPNFAVSGFRLSLRLGDGGGFASLDP